jgi:hypothetical protein
MSRDSGRKHNHRIASERAREAGDSIKPGAQAPGSRTQNIITARDSGRQPQKIKRCRPFHGLATYTQCFLGLAPQALCCRPLRGLKISQRLLIFR